MRIFKVTVSVGLVGCNAETTAEVEDDASQEEIDEAVKDAAMEHVEFWYEEEKVNV